jgi:C-terminal binding protein
MGVGYDRLDRDALGKRGVTVCNVPGTSGVTHATSSCETQVVRQSPRSNADISHAAADYGICEIADHAIALALSLRRGILLHDAKQRTELPAPYVFVDSPLVSRVRGRTFGVLGLGRIGTATALRAKAFG